jgi:hypothetical protein
VLAVTGSVLVNLGLFLFAFMVLTTKPLRLREVALGAAIATVFWEALQLIGTWCVAWGLRHATPTYGIFAVVITLLSWLYLGSQLVAWAAEINVVLRYRLWPRFGDPTSADPCQPAGVPAARADGGASAGGTGQRVLYRCGRRGSAGRRGITTRQPQDDVALIRSRTA